MKKELEKLETDNFKHLLNSVPILFCKKEVKRTIEIIDDNYGSGELPPDPIKVDFLNKLLNEKKECICGRGLEDGSEARKKVEEYRDRAPFSKYEPEIRHGQGEIKVLLSKISDFLTQRQSYYKEIDKIKNKTANLNEQLKLNEKGRKDFDEKEIESLISRRNFHFSEIERYNTIIGGKKNEMKDREKQKIIWEKQKRKLEKESIQNR